MPALSQEHYGQRSKNYTQVKERRHIVDVKKIENLWAGRDLDRRVSKALDWKCPEGCKSCDHIPSFSTNYYAAWVLRMEMEKRGWASKDDLTWMGWGDEKDHPWGYSIWFSRWVEHIRYTLVSTIHDPEKMPLAVSRCALLALTEPEAGMDGSSVDILKAIDERKKRKV